MNVPHQVGDCGLTAGLGVGLTLAQRLAGCSRGPERALWLGIPLWIRQELWLL